MAESLAASEHPYSQLLSREFRFVSDGEISHVAHEFLAPENHAYWDHEIRALAGGHGLVLVAQADFNYPWVEKDRDLESWLREHRIEGWGVADVVDLMLYRQHRSSVFALAHETAPLQDDELLALRVASSLAEVAGHRSPWRFGHPNGHVVEVTDVSMAQALAALEQCWPRSRPVRELLSLTPDFREDLILLARNGLIELRCAEPAWEISEERLHALEMMWSGGYRTTAAHLRLPLPDSEP